MSSSGTSTPARSATCPPTATARRNGYFALDGLALSQDGSVAASSHDVARVVRLGPVPAADDELWASPPREAVASSGTHFQSGDFSEIALSPDGSKVGYHTSAIVAGTPGT